MKIVDIKYEIVNIKLKKPIVIALGVIEYTQTMLVKVSTDEGIVGYGEASPFGPVTGELMETLPAVLDLLKKSLIGMDPISIEEIHAAMDKAIVGNTSAKAAIDLALFDIKGKLMNLPLYKVLGGSTNKVLTDITIGIGAPEEMAKEAVAFVKEGYNILKIKMGINPQEDVEAIRQIRQAVGASIKLRVDANQGWSVNEAIRTINELDKYNVDAVEQPLKYWDIEGTAIVRNKTKIKIMVDESLHSPIDALNIIKHNAADVFNIKLMKSCGLYPAIKINSMAESAGVNCMVGCMMETKLGIAAAANLVAAFPNITEADVDSFKYFDDETVTGGFTIEGDVITLSDKPGLGVDVNF